MKRETLSLLTEAHGWVGIFISVVLFIVFWAGALSLFYYEIKIWSEAPHTPINVQAEDAPPIEIIDKNLSQFPFDNSEPITVLLPDYRDPFYRIYFGLQPKENQRHGDHVGLTVDPKSGAVISRIEQFPLADFLYELHYNLKLPGGVYLVGIVTLFFLVTLMTGVLIHAKKMIHHFFMYRGDGKKRFQLLDMHNVIGVMSLPFTIMFAITGLVFNLAILYEMSSAVFLYQGDQKAMAQDAGYTTAIKAPANSALDMTSVGTAIQRIESTYQNPVRLLRFYNYGDKNTVVRITGDERPQFAQRFEVFYRVHDGKILNRIDSDNINVFRTGIDVVAALHFGSIAGMDVRIIYFILSLGVCALIVVGNWLWLEKRRRKKKVSVMTKKWISSMTLGGCSGVVLATSIALFAERILPVAWESRGDIVIGGFLTALLGCSIAALFTTHIAQFIGRLLIANASVLLLTLGADGALFGTSLLSLYSSGFWSILGVQVTILLFAVSSLWIGKFMLKKPTQKTEEAGRDHDWSESKAGYSID